MYVKVEIKTERILEQKTQFKTLEFKAQRKNFENFYFERKTWFSREFVVFKSNLNDPLYRLQKNIFRIVYQDIRGKFWLSKFKSPHFKSMLKYKNLKYGCFAFLQYVGRPAYLKNLTVGYRSTDFNRG